MWDLIRRAEAIFDGIEFYKKDNKNFDPVKCGTNYIFNHHQMSRHFRFVRPMYVPKGTPIYVGRWKPNAVIRDASRMIIVRAQSMKVM